MTQPTPPQETSFESRKRKILADLSIPDEEYTDLSPKGSVDEGIRNLIHDINGLPGLVTTSSCAGRISVFLEGRKKQAKKKDLFQEHQQQHEGQDQVQWQRQFVPSGGKGAGRWLYVSHRPITGVQDGGDDGAQRNDVKSWHGAFGLVPGVGRLPRAPNQGLVRFHYDPMILHIMTDTLHHATPILSAASSAGFRESGLQSLRCLEDTENAHPIVAVRSSGLSLESIIGYCEDSPDDGDGDGNEPLIRSLVSEEYLEMLVAISNERFSVNAERKERFRTSLMELCAAEQQGQGLKGKGKGKTKPPGWEDPEKRRERMRAEGLMRKKLLEKHQAEAGAGGMESTNKGDNGL